MGVATVVFSGSLMMMKRATLAVGILLILEASNATPFFTGGKKDGGGGGGSYGAPAQNSGYGAPKPSYGSGGGQGGGGLFGGLPDFGQIVNKKFGVIKAVINPIVGFKKNLIEMKKGIFEKK